jgi:hypothetical protein
MNPWTIIGWSVTACICIAVLVFIGLIAAVLLARCWLLGRHYATRNTPPAVGQVWIDKNGERYPIESVDRFIGFRIKSESGVIWFSWAKDEWRRGVRSRRMWLFSTEGGAL